MTRAVVGGLVLAAAFAGSGCGGGGSKTATVPVSALANAVRATQATGSYSFTIGGTLDLGGQSFPIHGAGAADARTGSARASLDLTQALAASGIGSISADEARADAVVAGGVLYVRSPYLARRRGLHRPWIRYGQGDVGPGRVLGYLRAVDVVKRLGPDTIDGVNTTHYTTGIDFRRYAQTARPGEMPALNAIMRVTGGSLPVDVWVDAADRIRRIQTQVGTASFQAVPQLDIGGFGRPVAVRVPPAAQVAAPR